MSKQPASWDEALKDAGLVDPRNGKPSRNQLAQRTKISGSSINAIIEGRQSPSASTVHKIAEALGVDVRVVSAWVGQERTERTPYAPPAEADLLTDRQRRAVDEIIRAIVAERASARDDNHQSSRRPTTARRRAVARPPQPDGFTPGERRRPLSRDEQTITETLEEVERGGLELTRHDFDRAADDSGPSLLEHDDALAARRGEESQDPEDWT